MTDQLITRKEILKGHSCPEEFENNLLELLIKVNNVRDAFGRPMIISSGFRSKEDHIRIYKEKGIPEYDIPWGSCHLKCLAVDIYDPKKELQEWIKKNLPLMEKIGVWFEDFSYTQTWVHIQTCPPKSMKRFYIP